VNFDFLVHLEPKKYRAIRCKFREGILLPIKKLFRNAVKNHGIFTFIESWLRDF